MVCPGRTGQNPGRIVVEEPESDIFEEPLLDEQNLFDPFRKLRGTSSLKKPDEFAESSGYLSDGIGSLQDSVGFPATEGETKRNDTPINSSVDIVVAQATELATLMEIKSTQGGDYQVVGTLPEALAIAAMRPELSHIQLRTNYARIVQPLQIRADRLSISAAEGYDPIIRFAPEGAAPSVNSATGVGMIEVHKGIIRFEGIHFELDTRSYTQPCSLFLVHRAELLSLSDCWVRIVSDPVEIVSYETSFVAVAPAESGDETGPLKNTFANRKVATPEIQCRNVIFGGEATVLRVPEGRPLRMAWSNGFVATSRAFAEIGGVAGVPGEADQIVIDLDHITAVIDQGLCRSVASSELSNLLTVDLHATRSILISPETQPLLMSIGHGQNVDQLESHMLFNGERNFYEGTEIFWEKMQLPRTGVALTMPIQMDFDEWQNRWQTERTALATQSSPLENGGGPKPATSLGDPQGLFSKRRTQQSGPPGRWWESTVRMPDSRRPSCRQPLPSYDRSNSLKL